VLVLFLAVYEGHWFKLEPEQWSQEKYGGQYLGTGQVVEEIDQALLPGECYFEWSDVPRFYYAADRPMAVGVVFPLRLLKGPLAAQLTQRVLGDLERRRPELVVWDKEWNPPGLKDQPVQQYLLAHYRPYTAFGVSGRYEFWCRLDGRIDRSLSIP
jgi:hypothetical protein